MMSPGSSSVWPDGTDDIMKNPDVLMFFLLVSSEPVGGVRTSAGNRPVITKKLKTNKNSSTEDVDRRINATPTLPLLMDRKRRKKNQAFT